MKTVYNNSANNDKHTIEEVKNPLLLMGLMLLFLPILTALLLLVLEMV